MKITRTSPLEQQPGAVAELLGRSYDELLSSDSVLWEQERAGWREYDREIFRFPDSVGACAFLTWVDGRLAGFGSYDPRPGPELGIIGHNCVLPEFRGNGLGKEQIAEILSRFRARGIRAARVSTNSHPFFLPAQRMYLAYGFTEVGRKPWDRDPSLQIIEFVTRLDKR